MTTFLELQNQWAQLHHQLSVWTAVSHWLEGVTVEDELPSSAGGNVPVEVIEEVLEDLYTKKNELASEIKKLGLVKIHEDKNQKTKTSGTSEGKDPQEPKGRQTKIKVRGR